MIKKSERLLDLEKRFDFSIDSVSEQIAKSGKMKILLQFPDGLKSFSLDILDYLQERNKEAEIKIWLGSCFGACDIPQSKSELLIQFGHSEFRRN